MKIFGVVLLLYGLVPVVHAQDRGQIVIDVVENDRRCRNDGGIVRECHVAYGHYKDHPAFWPTGPKKPPLITFRVALLCERGELGRKDCIPLEEGKTYRWSAVDIDEHYPYN